MSALILQWGKSKKGHYDSLQNTSTWLLLRARGAKLLLGVRVEDSLRWRIVLRSMRWSSMWLMVPLIPLSKPRSPGQDFLTFEHKLWKLHGCSSQYGQLNGDKNWLFPLPQQTKNVPWLPAGKKRHSIGPVFSYSFENGCLWHHASFTENLTRCCRGFLDLYCSPILLSRTYASLSWNCRHHFDKTWQLERIGSLNPEGCMIRLNARGNHSVQKVNFKLQEKVDTARYTTTDHFRLGVKIYSGTNVDSLDGWWNLGLELNICGRISGQVL